MLALIIIGYLTCSFLAWGFTLGSYTKSFAYFNNWRVAALAALLGPVGLIAGLIGDAQDGAIAWRITPLSKEQRWEAFKEAYKYLGRDFFEQHHG